jgi:hypothetical protein
MCASLKDIETKCDHRHDCALNEAAFQLRYNVEARRGAPGGHVGGLQAGVHTGFPSGGPPGGSAGGSPGGVPQVGP